MKKQTLSYLALGLGLCLAPALANAAKPEAPLRGFTVGNVRPETLRDAKKDWNANIVRWQLNSIDSRAAREGISKKESFKKVISELPAGLDEAKKLGMTVVIALPQLSLTERDPNLTTRQELEKFWKDEDGETLQTWIDAWKQIAEICAQRPDQDIWFNLMNEPLDWTQVPSYPKEWPVWAQRMIDEVRKIDTVHPFVIEPGPGGLCWGFKDFPLLKDDNLIYSVHQYQPHQYTHQGVSDIRNTDLARAYLERQLSWPGTFGDSGGGHWDKARLYKELAPVFEFAKRHPDVRIYVGEFSVIRWAPDAAQYLRDNIEIFEEQGWDWTYHAFREYNGWSPEFDNNFSTPEEAKKATGITDRGAVLKEFMDLNPR